MERKRQWRLTHDMIWSCQTTSKWCSSPSGRRCSLFLILLALISPSNLLPFLFLLSMPCGPIARQCILSLTPRFAFTSRPPINSADFGIEFISEFNVSLKPLCSVSSTVWYTEDNNSFKYPILLLPHWYKFVKDSLTTIKLPANEDPNRVVIVVLDQASLQDITAVGDRMIETPTSTIPLEPGSFSPMLYMMTMWYHNIMTKFPRTQVSCTQ